MPGSVRPLQLIVPAATTRSSAGRVERRARPKSSDHEHSVSACTRAASGCFSHTRNDIRDWKSAGDAEISKACVEHKGRSERIVRAGESRLPEGMTDQDEPLPLLGFFGRKVAP